MGYMNDTFGTAAASNDYTRNQYGAGNAYLDNVYPAALATDLNSQNVLNQRYDAAGNIINRLPGENVTAGDTSAIAQTSYDQAMSKMQPQIKAQETTLSQSLQDRGIPVGSDIYNNEMNRQGQSVNDLMSSAARQAQLDAGTEQSRQVTMNTALQLTPYQELSALNAGQYSAQNPNVAATSATYTAPAAQTWNQFQPATTNATQAYSSYDQANAANNASIMNGLFGLGKAAVPFLAKAATPLLASDENYKTNRKTADGEHTLLMIREMPVDSYNYTQEAQQEHGVPPHRVGPMAQDWQEAFPESSDGHMIDMGGMLGRLTAAVKALEARTAHQAS
jgi:hypothetical protein